jgi:uncharacterized membrane protein (GlpM family)
VKKFIDQRPVLNALLTGLGIACAALVGMSVVLLFLEALSATRGVMPSPSILPSPEDRRVVAALVLAAMAIGFSRARKHFNRHADFSPWSIAPALVVVVVAVILVGWSRHNEQRYLSEALPYFPTASAATLKDDGHEACDWLRGRHWGAPPEIPGRREFRFYNAIAHGDYAAPDPTSHVSQSTGRSFIFYTRYLRRQSGGTLTPDGKLKRQVAFLAWYKLCPFQQWVHTPITSGGAGD